MVNWEAKRIVYDPSGIAAWGERCNQLFLQANPDVDLKLTLWHREYAAWKADRSRPLSIPPIQDLQAELCASAKPVQCKPFLKNGMGGLRREGAGGAESASGPPAADRSFPQRRRQTSL